MADGGPTVGDVLSDLLDRFGSFGAASDAVRGGGRDVVEESVRRASESVDAHRPEEGECMSAGDCCHVSECGGRMVRHSTFNQLVCDVCGAWWFGGLRWPTNIVMPWLDPKREEE